MLALLGSPASRAQVLRTVFALSVFYFFGEDRQSIFMTRLANRASLPRCMIYPVHSEPMLHFDHRQLPVPPGPTLWR